MNKLSRMEKLKIWYWTIKCFVHVDKRFKGAKRYKYAKFMHTVIFGAALNEKGKVGSVTFSKKQNRCRVHIHAEKLALRTSTIRKARNKK